MSLSVTVIILQGSSTFTEVDGYSEITVRPLHVRVYFTHSRSHGSVTKAVSCHKEDQPYILYC